MSDGFVGCGIMGVIGICAAILLITSGLVWYFEPSPQHTCEIFASVTVVMVLALGTFLTPMNGSPPGDEPETKDRM